MANEKFTVRLVFKSGHVEEVQVAEWTTEANFRGEKSVKWASLPLKGVPVLHHLTLDEVVFISVRSA